MTFYKSTQILLGILNKENWLIQYNHHRPLQYEQLTLQANARWYYGKTRNKGVN